MITATRRIGAALLLISVFSFGVTYLATGISVCRGLGSCTAAVALSNSLISPNETPNNNTGLTTDNVDPVSAAERSMLPLGIELTALYIFAVALVMLIVAEFYDPKLLKRIVGSRKFS